MKAKTGHLSHSGLNLKQTEKVRQELSKATTARYALQKIKPVLDWKQKGEK